MPTPNGFANCSVRIQLTGFTRPAFVTFGVEDNTGFDPTGLADVVRDAWLATVSMNSQLDSSTTATEFTVRVGQPAGDDAVGSVSSTVVGGRALNSGPPSQSVLIHKRTARAGRAGRGRLFMPWWGLTAGELPDNGLIATAQLNTMNATVDTWLAAHTAASAPLVLLHPTPSTPVRIPDLITDLSVDPLISTQRRRLGR